MADAGKLDIAAAATAFDRSAGASATRAGALDQALEERYRFVVDALPIIAWSYREDGQIAYLNRQWSEYTGAAHGYVRAYAALIEWIHPDDRAAVVAAVKAGGESWEVQYRLRRADGVYRWHLGRAVTSVDGQGRVWKRLGTAMDIDDQKRVEARQTFLSRASVALFDAVGCEAALAEAARLAVPDFACGAEVYAARRDGVERVAAFGVPATRDPRDVERAIAAREPTHLEATADGRSWICVPIAARGAPVGALAFTAGGERRLAVDDLAIAEELARRMAIAVENAALYDAERRAVRRLWRLQEVAAALSGARTVADVARAAVRLGADAAEATNGAVWLADADGVLHLVAYVNTPASFIEQWSVVFPGADAPAAAVLATGRPRWVSDAREHADGAPSFFRAAQRAGRALAHAVLPLMVDGRPIGVYRLGFGGEHGFGEDEQAFLLTLAQHAAQALARAQSLEAERRSTERLGLLARLGARLASSIDFDAMLRNVADVAAPQLADFCVLELDGDPPRREVGGLRADLRERAARVPWAPSDRAALIEPIDELWMRTFATSEAHVELLRDVRLTSLVTVPLFVRDERIGALTLCYGASGRAHGEADVELAEEIARRAAVAIEQARLYRASQDAARRAEDANRTKDEFLATVSHELRTPLNAILGWASILRREGRARGASMQKALDVIHRNATAQTKLIDDILDVARIVTGKLRLDPQPVSVEAIVRDAIEVVRPSAAVKGIALELSSMGDGAFVRGDPDRLRQVAWNLLSNAVKFTDDGGVVRVSVRSAADEVVLVVRDDGRGITPELLPHVFERFRQGDGSTTRALGGLGLGLAIVRHLVELHGGSVRAESAGAGRGATFTVTLPAAADARGDELDAPPPPPSHVDAAAAARGATVRGLRVLVVDDEHDAREIVKHVLEASGARVDAVGSVAEALDAAARGAYQVIVSDIGMPEQDGYAFVTKLRARGRTTPAVALTAYARAEDRDRAMHAGFDAYVAKPVDPERLRAVVARAARRK